MADISKIQLSDNTQYNLKDAVARSLLTENDTSTGDISKIQLSDNTQYNIKDAQARQDIETVTTDVKAQVNADKDLINGGNDFIDDETLDDYDDKIEEMQEAYKKFIPIQTTSGTEITLDNSNNDKVLVDIGLDGNTEQFTTTGKNLLQYAYDLGYTTTINGITWTINQDGSITANGTASSVSILQFSTGTELAPLVGQTIKFNGTPTNAPVNTYLGLYNADWSALINVVGGADVSATITSNTTRALVRVGAGETVNNLTFYPMVRLSSVTDATYEPYTGGQASPNPSYPQEVKVVTGENTIDIVGRNLYNKDTTIAGFLGNDGTFNASVTAWNTSDYIRIVGGESYNFNFQPITAGSYWQSRTVFYDKNKNYLSGSDLNSYPTNYTQTFTAPSGAYYVRMSFTNVNTYERKDIQVNTGSTAHSYEPYQSQSYPISLGSLELAKISIYKDKIYNNDNDKKWYLRKEIGKVILDGSETWSLATGTNFYRFILTDNTFMNSLALQTIQCVYSNMFKGISFVNRNNYYNETCYQTSNGLSTGLGMGINTNAATTIVDFKAWLETNTPTVYYILATPTDTEITDENLISQLEAVKLLSGTQNNFTIDADTLPTLNLNYIGETNPHL